MFRFNCTFMLLQQIFCIVFFTIVSFKSKMFKEKAGEISFNDFLKHKCFYFSFATVFILYNITCFYGTQLIVNVGMFQTLRKTTLVILYIIDLISGSKRAQFFTGICVFLVTFGGVLSGVDTFSRDYYGILIVMLSNIMTATYNKLTEIFRKKTKVPNLKLLVYNSYLAAPCLVILGLVSGEFRKLNKYFHEERYKGENGDGSFKGLVLSLFCSCSFVIILNSSFFLSNEKNSSTFTVLMANSKDIFSTVLSYVFLKKNSPTVKVILGLLISTLGAMMFSSKSIWENTKKIGT